MEYYPTVVPYWDNNLRNGIQGVVPHDSTVYLFQDHFREAIDQVSGLPKEHRLVFAKSWIEWTEDNNLEFDLRFGRRYLDVDLNERSRPAAYTMGT